MPGDNLQLLEERFELRGRTFVVRELTMDQLLPLTGDEMSDVDRSKRIIEASVILDGNPVDPGRLPAAVFNMLAKVVMRVNGLGAEEKEEDPRGNA